MLSFTPIPATSQHRVYENTEVQQAHTPARRRHWPGIARQLAAPPTGSLPHQEVVNQTRGPVPEILTFNQRTGQATSNRRVISSGYICPLCNITQVKAVHDKVRTLEMNRRKKSLPLHAYILMGALNDIRPVQLTSRTGATVSEWLTCSPPTKAIRVQSPAESLRIFARGNRAGRVFSGISRFPHALSLRCCSILTTITLIGSKDLDVKSRPNFFTRSLTNENQCSCSRCSSNLSRMPVNACRSQGHGSLRNTGVKQTLVPWTRAARANKMASLASKMSERPSRQSTPAWQRSQHGTFDSTRQPNRQEAHYQRLAQAIGEWARLRQRKPPRCRFISVDYILCYTEVTGEGPGKRGAALACVQERRNTAEPRLDGVDISASPRDILVPQPQPAAVEVTAAHAPTPGRRGAVARASETPPDAWEARKGR
ncbi:hypothetical protein PR048_029282 [Dryococelus australis]|uniref:Uncharacterized protein n=1 Tax=Dryococelus australis TaxID=614101 RepID=A0ABQ9GD06_9NEOP|nr:hypothetical protein PR048_029282 [Dryococelus australis]